MESKRIETYLPYQHKFPGCADLLCRGTNRDGTAVLPHRECVVCGGQTCSWSILIEPETLRRKKFPLCTGCPKPEEQKALRAQRTLRDWGKVTDPVETELLTEEMTEQYRSRVRAALRAFVDSGFEEATIEQVKPGIAQESIRVLGLEHLVYAEQRDKSTVFRRVT